MFAIAGGSSLADSPLNWSLFFARQPEPDLEFTEEELEQTTSLRSSSPMNSPKKSGGRPVLWILLLAVLGGGAYVAMEPEMVMDLVGPLLGESPTPPPQPPVAMKPPARPAPPAPAAQPAPVPAAPSSAASTPTPQTTAPAPTASVTPAQMPTPAPAPSVPTASAPELAAALPPVTATPDPLFSEGQTVSLLATPGAPRGATVPLMKDAAGTKQGPAIPPGTVLKIVDGDFQNDGWVYFIRSNYGTTGWVTEKQLKLKP
jgi:hypothetical protein